MKKYVFLLVVLPLVAFQTHKYYLSLTKIVHVKESKSIQITSRIFIDDLEKVLDTKYTESFKLATKNELKDSNKYINEYIGNHLKITINGEPIAYSYLGKKYETDVVYLFAEIENIAEIKSIEVRNTMLMNEFEAQQNIIKLDINNKRKSFILTADSDKDLLKF